MRIYGEKLMCFVESSLGATGRIWKCATPLLADLSLLFAALVVLPALFIGIVHYTSEAAEKDAVRQYLAMYYPEFNCEEVTWDEPVAYGGSKLVRLKFRAVAQPGECREYDHVFCVSDGVASLIALGDNRSWNGI